MTPTLFRTLLLLFIWLIVAVAGISFIRSAFHGRKSGQNSRLAVAVNEVRFRLRLAFGVILLFLVASGVVWMFTNGIK
jgi:hypothetical protein